MNKFVKVFLLLLSGVFFTIGNAMAFPIVAPYWTLTDLNQSQNSRVEILKDDTPEVEFGVFTVDSIDNPTMITEWFKIFDPWDEQGDKVSFEIMKNGNNWEARVFDINDNMINQDLTFSNIFGFYFKKLDGPAWEIYSDSSFDNAGGQSISMNYWASGYELDLSFIDEDGQTTQMKISADDVKPIPEPATLALLGIGLLVLAGITRKNIKT